MLKKMIIISAVILAVCLVAFFALSPLAVSDAVQLAQEAAPSYAVLSELSQYSAENIEAVTLAGYWVNSLEVRLSADQKIHVLTDNYCVYPPIFKSHSAKDGIMELYCSSDNPSPITLLTRENIQRLIVAELNSASLNRIILELPSAVAFEPGEYGKTYYSLSIDERVKVLEQETPAASNEATSEEGSEEIDIPESESSYEAVPIA